MSAAAPLQQLPAASAGWEWPTAAADPFATGEAQQLVQNVWAAQTPPLLPPQPPQQQRPLHHQAQTYCVPQQLHPQPQWPAYLACGNWGAMERQPTIGDLDLGCLGYVDYTNGGAPPPGSLPVCGHGASQVDMQGVQASTDWLQDIEVRWSLLTAGCT